MEILLYLAGCRQIKKAIEMLGVKKNSNKIIGVLVAETREVLPEAYTFLCEIINLIPEISIIEDFSSKREWFVQQLLDDKYYNAANFCNAEIEKAQLEKVALLALNT